MAREVCLVGNITIILNSSEKSLGSTVVEGFIILGGHYEQLKLCIFLYEPIPVVQQKQEIEECH